MTKKIWTINLEDGAHTVELQHGAFSGKRNILVDNVELSLPQGEKRQFIDAGSTHTFSIMGHECRLIIYSAGFGFKYELEVDGKSIDQAAPSFERQSGQSDIATEASRANRISALILFFVLGIIALWANWHLSHNQGVYYPILAMLGPAVLVMAGYYSIFSDDPSITPKPIPLRLIVAFVLAFLLAGINWFATAQGLY